MGDSSGRYRRGQGRNSGRVGRYGPTRFRGSTSYHVPTASNRPRSPNQIQRANEYIRQGKIATIVSWSLISLVDENICSDHCLKNFIEELVIGWKAALVKTDLPAAPVRCQRITSGDLTDIKQAFRRLKLDYPTLDICICVLQDKNVVNDGSPFYHEIKDITDGLDLTKQNVVASNVITIKPDFMDNFCLQVNRKVLDWKDKVNGNRRNGDAEYGASRGLQHPHERPQRRGRGRGAGRHSVGSMGNGTPLDGVDSAITVEPTEVFPIGFEKLNEYLQMKPDEIVMLLCEPSFAKRLSIVKQQKNSDIYEDTILAVIAKATETNFKCTRQHLSDLLSIVAASNYVKDYLTRILSEWTLSMQRLQPRSRANLGKNLSNLLIIIIAIFERRPASLHEVNALAVMLRMIGQEVERRLSELWTAEFQTLFNRFQENYDAVCEREREKNTVRVDGVPTMDDAAPPDDFRLLKIFPTQEDILTVVKPFVRKNIVCGKYQDVEHYLDVQFRLLREDFVDPIRKGVRAYIDMPKAVRAYNQDIRIYQNVRILAPEFSKNGVLAYRIKFDSTHFKNVKWEISKRLIFGSLICLSSDFFETMFFATVFDRKVADLQKGEFKVCFENRQIEAAGVNGSEVFTMAESTAYFEAYRHVLKGLQEMPKGEDFPFSRYLVSCEQDVGRPKYLDGEIANSRAFDFSSIIPSEKRATSFMSKIGDVNTWPTRELLGLDEFQYRAMQLALTHEIALIQGPPGTGKTFIGWNIAKVLLADGNCSLWRKEPNPILVICYTNHALDQFLEGIAHFTSDGIIRIGGRCKSPNLEKFLLHNVMMNSRGTLPPPLRHRFYEQRRIMEGHEETTKRMGIQLSATEKGLMRFEHLVPYMVQRHHDEFVTRRKATGRTEDELLKIWLTENFGVVMEQPQAAGLAMQVNQDAQNDEGDDDVDVEALEVERMLDDDDGNLDLPMDEQRFMSERQRRERREQHLQEELAKLQADLVQNDWLTVVRGKAISGEDVAQKQVAESIIKELSSVDICTAEEAEAKGFHALVTMPHNERWRLYRFWIQKYAAKLHETMREHQRQYEECAQRMHEIKNQEFLHVLQGAKVIGMTTTGAAKHQGLLQLVRPKITIIEEAAEVLEAHIVTALSQGCQHLILIGDHKQLRPNPAVYHLAKHYKLDVSLFERLILNKIPHATLGYQHRMRPEIADSLMPHFYESLRNAPNVSKYLNVLGVTKNMFFIDHSEPEADEGDSKSHKNKHEALWMVALTQYLIQQGYEHKQITILCPYTGQMFHVKKLLREKLGAGCAVHVTAVDNYQGEENEIILLSLTRSNSKGRIGFLKTKNRVCVALSRAKQGFYVAGNFQCLAAASKDLWTDLIRDLTAHGYVNKQFSIQCQIHKTVRAVCKPEDFAFLAPDGGCREPCDFKMDCGHVCQRLCHPEDTEHEKVQCMRKCDSKCPAGHACQKMCYQCTKAPDNCGRVRCAVKVSKTVPRCGHKIEAPCYQPAREVSCTAPCEVDLPCGHRCEARCSEPHTRNCQKKIKKTRSACGHEIDVPCCRDANDEQCKMQVDKLWSLCGHRSATECWRDPTIEQCAHRCDATLVCGHQCTGTCGQCRRGRLHIRCSQPCQRVLICGHQCRFQCCEACPPCSLPCEVRCAHSSCCSKKGGRKCGIPCPKCKEKCNRKCDCPDKPKCELQCSELCQQKPCDEPCRKVLKCGHACVGLCGEKCPFCIVCKPEKFENVSMLGPVEPDARYLILEDCGHMVVASEMDQWMTTEDGDAEQPNQRQEIVMKGCYFCKRPIFATNRYSNLVKLKRADVEKVKLKMCGQVEELDGKRNEILEQFHRSEAMIQVTSPRCASLCNRLKQALEKPKKNELQAQMLAKLENFVKFLVRLSEFWRRVSLKVPDTAQSSNFGSPTFHLLMVRWLTHYARCKRPYETERAMDLRIHDHLEDEWNAMLDWMEKHLDTQKTVSEQMLFEFTCEVNRLEMLGELTVIFMTVGRRQAELPRNLQSCTYEAFEVLYGSVPCGDHREIEVRAVIDELDKEFPSNGLGISDKERIAIIKAIGLSKGHWFKCPNDHVYAIGECGGAMQESKCPECGSAIGGTQHALRADNALASEMDGAQHASWGNEANMNQAMVEQLRNANF